MNVDISFPLWTDNWVTNTANTSPVNDGSMVTNVIKLVIGTAADPVEDYYGFWVPRG